MTDIKLHSLLEDLLKQYGEGDGFIELKKNNHDKTGEYISALSNDACLKNREFGFLIFGVSDSGEIVGTTVNFKKLKRENQLLELWLRTHAITPVVNFEIFHFEKDGKPIAIIQIPAANGQPTEYLGKPYGRIGESKTELHKLSPEKVIRLWHVKEDWSKQVVDKATVNDLDEAALAKAREKFKERMENARYAREVNSWNIKTFLNKAELAIDGKITNAALLLLGKRESRHLLKNSNASEITWELKTKEESAYERFYPPFILSTTEVWRRIRNTKLKLFPSHELLAKEVSKYDEDVILEALHNCIAHQDYFSNDRGIIVTEEADKLTFTSIGNFFEGRAEDYVLGKKDKAQNYRNHFLVSGMVNIGMIDKMGYGIKSMFKAQRRKYFPMPDYNKSTLDKVVLQIYGNVIDEKFSRILMEQTELDDRCVISLDHIQKGIQPNEDVAKFLKRQKLIEGRKGRYFIAAEIASVTDQKAKYIKNKAFDKQHYKALILQFLSRYTDASRKEIDELLMDKLSEILSITQKKKKVDNLLYEMASKDKTIKNIGTFKKSLWRKLGEN